MDESKMQLSYTSKAKEALLLAQKIAKSLKQNYVRSEHILVGLVQQRTGVAAKVLSENEVEAGKLLELIKELVAPNSNVVMKEREGY